MNMKIKNINKWNLKMKFRDLFYSLNIIMYFNHNIFYTHFCTSYAFCKFSVYLNFVNT